MFPSVVSPRDVIEVPGEEGVEDGVDDDADRGCVRGHLGVEDVQEGEGVEDHGDEEDDAHPLYDVGGVLLVVLFDPLVPLEGHVQGKDEEDEQDDANVPKLGEEGHDCNGEEDDDLEQCEVAHDFHTRLDWDEEAALVVFLHEGILVDGFGHLFVL